MEWVVPFLFGLIYGSFLNVVVLRFDDWLSILTTRSRCPDCQTQLRWYDLIPVISYATLRGRCRYCEKPISGQYPLVEIVTGILLVAGYGLVFHHSLEQVSAVTAYAFYVLAVGAMVIIFCHDLYEMMVPDSVSYFLLLSAFAFGWLFTGNLIATLLGGLTGILPIALLVYPSQGKWMGEGDIKLAAGLGMLVGYPSAIVFLFGAFLSGGAYGLLAVLFKKAGLKSAVPFAPFLILGALIALFYGPSLIHWYIGMIYGY